MLMAWTIKLSKLCWVASNPPYIMQCNSFRSSIIRRVNIHIHLFSIWVNVKSSCYSLLRGVWLRSSILSWNKRLLLNQACVPFHSTLHTISNNPCLQLWWSKCDHLSGPCRYFVLVFLCSTRFKKNCQCKIELAICKLDLIFVNGVTTSRNPSIPSVSWIPCWLRANISECLGVGPCSRWGFHSCHLV